MEDSLPKVKEACGIRRLYPVRNQKGEVFHFLNLFSANDPQSTAHLVEEVRASYPSVCFLYNHREDRPDRALLFARYFFSRYQDCTVFLTGRGAPLPKRLFQKAGVTDLRIVSDCRDCLEEMAGGALLIGIGNIKGPGYRLIEELEKNADTQKGEFSL